MADIRTVIGEHNTVRGTLQGSEDVVVFGYVEGRVVLDGTLFVEPPGVVKANVEARHVVIGGIVVGDVRASECIEVSAEGRVVGNLSTPRLVMAAGAAVRGRVTMSEEPAPAQQPAREPARVEPSAASRPTESMPAIRRTEPPVAAARPATPEPAAWRPWERPAETREQERPKPVERAAAPERPAPEKAPAPERPTPEKAPAPERPAPERQAERAPAARREPQDLDALFPAVPESSMDSWAAPVTRDDPQNDRNR